MSSAADWIDRLKLEAHPEGGYYRETYRSEAAFPGRQDQVFPAGRSHSTAIYFLLEKDNFSAFHRIQSDELWHVYDGDGLDIHVLHPQGEYSCLRLGTVEGRMPQAKVEAGCWFASEVSPGGSFALVGCTVSPGFDFTDFEMADAVALSSEFPQHRNLIGRLTR
jgi:hypothetical protein